MSENKQAKMAHALKRLDEHLRDVYESSKKDHDFKATVTVDVSIEYAEIEAGIAVAGHMLTSNEEMLERIKEAHEEQFKAIEAYAHRRAELHKELTKIRQKFMDNMVLSPTDDFFLMLEQYKQQASQLVKE